MILSAVSVLVVAQSSSEIPEGLMNNLVSWLLLNVDISKLQIWLQSALWAGGGEGRYFFYSQPTVQKL